MNKYELRFSPIALRPKDAAEALGISESLLEDLVKAGKVHKPVPIPGHRARRYDYQQLIADWQAWSEEPEVTNPWDAS